MPDVRFPRLLAANGAEARRLNPTALSLALIKNDVSTAHLALSEDDTPPDMLALVEIYTLKGSAGLFRVSQIDTPAAGPCGIDLRHAITTLHDSVWNNRLDTNGNLLDTEYDGTVAGYMAAILSHQRTVRWQLGTCADPGAYKKSGLNHDHLDDLLLSLAQDRAGYMLAYDFSTSPWTVSLAACDGSVTAECRLTRNLKDGRRRLTASGFANRLYLTVTKEEKKDTAPAIWSGGEHKGQATGNVTADEDKTTQTGAEYRVYNDLASQALYGVVEGTAEISLNDVPDADAWAAQYFQDHASPISSASADAYEIVKETGEPWDQYDLGKWVRIALTRPGFPAEGPVEKVSYGDLLAEPDKAQVELTRKLPKISERLSALKSASDAASRYGGGGGAAKAQEMTHWAQVVQHIEEELEGTGLRQLWETGIELDAQQGVTLYSLYDGISSNYASIRLLNDAIVLKVSAGEVATQLAVELGNVTISGGNLVVSGYVTANQLQSEIASFYNTATGTLSADWVTAQGGQIGSLTCSGSLRVGGASSYYEASWQSATIGGVTINYLGR